MITNIVLVVCISIIVIMFFYFKWYIGRRTSVSGLLPEYRSEVNRLISEIDAATERNLMLVEDSIKKLKEILEDADKRILAYRKELEKSRNLSEASKATEALYTNLRPGIRAALKTEASVLSPVRPNIGQLEIFPASTGFEIAPDTTPLKNVPADNVQPLTPVKDVPLSRHQIRSSIDLLANEGLSPEEIARRLDISIAEVDLAMNLRRKKS